MGMLWELKYEVWLWRRRFIPSWSAEDQMRSFGVGEVEVGLWIPFPFV